MAKYIVLLRETEAGEARIKDTVGRAAAFRDAAKGMGVAVTGQFWTMGQYDGVLMFDAPDAETAAAAVHHLMAQGSVRAETLRAFDAAEMAAVLSKTGA